MLLYLYILLGSVIVPALFSIFFIDFIKKWKHFFLSTSVVAFFFLLWDAWFTANGVWGFNESYCAGLFLLGMPIEEWLFFFIIPFCSLFTHFAFFYAFPNLKLSKRITIGITLVLIGLAFCLAILNYDRAYTCVNFLVLVVVLLQGLKFGVELLQQFYISFLIVLIPFFIVNGILTGAGIDSPIVWYNNADNLNIRFYTIPCEDIGYAFSMLYSNLLIFNYLNTKWKTT